MTTKENNREYHHTHPWLTFSFDTRQLDYRVWLLLGEAKSKFEHILGAPLLPGTIEEMTSIYLAKGALATTAIEGNTLTESEVEKRIKGELELPPSKEYLGQEIDNVVEAINLIGQKIISEHDSDDISVKQLCEYNSMVLQNLPLREDVIPGTIRNFSVGVASYRGAPVEDLDYLLERYVKWLNEEFVFPNDKKMIYGILKAIMAHLYFVWIHPFADGNGRTARLIEFQILLSVGAPAVAAHLLSNHYNSTRSEYYRLLEKSSKSTEAVVEFIHYALQGLVDGLRSEIINIQNQQIKVHWINHLHNSFKGLKSENEERKKELLLEITKVDQVNFTFEQVRHTSPRIAEMYANLSDRTMKRDLADLVKMKLLVTKKNQYQLNLSVLQLFMTVSRK